MLFSPTGNFQNPGARSLGLGGAFAGLADDASAAELNPAGLTQLKRPEISLEYRRLETPITVRYADAGLFGSFECVAGDAGSGPCGSTFLSRENSLTFVSLLLPIGSRATVAIYRHELDRERFGDVRPALDAELGQSSGFLEQLDRRILRTGLSFAWALTDQLSLGTTVNLNSMTQTFSATEYYTDGAGGRPSFLASIQEASIKQEKLGVTGGLFWRPVRPLSVGVSYSTRVRFDESGNRSFCANATTGCGFAPDGTPDPANIYDRNPISSSFTLPSRLGVAAALRPAPWLTIAAETDRVTYADNDIGVERFDSDGTAVGVDRLVGKDVWEIHGGVEALATFSRSVLGALRAGYWRDPDHSFRYGGCFPVPGQQCPPDPVFARRNPPAGARDHITAGLGIAWAWGQLDLGYDWMRQTRTGIFSASVVVRAK